MKTLSVLALMALPMLAADQAAGFFDDSAVREIRLYFEDANWYNTLFQSHNSNPADPNFPARFQYGETGLPRIGVRFKGNSSFRRNGIKKPFKLDFNEYDGNATFLGLKKLNLHPGDLQPDFLHEKLFLDFAGARIAALRAVHVRLYVNDAYYGLYLAVEQPDKTMMQSRFGNDEDGNLYEAGESVSANMAYLGPNASSYTTRYELKTNESANDYSGLIQLIEVLNNNPAALEPIMDVENFLTSLALNAAFTNLESYTGTAGEYFLYDRTRDGKFVHIHWDLNETFGSTGDGTPRIANPFTMDVFYGSNAAGNNARPLIDKLMSVPAYRRLYLQTLARMLRGGFDEQTFAANTTRIANLIRPHLAADPNKAYTMAQFETALTNQVTANGFTTYSPTQFVRERAAFLRTYLNSQTQPADLRLNKVTPAAIEILNLGPGTLGTSGYTLSDDPAVPAKWTLSSRTLADGESFTHLWTAPAAGATLYLYAGGTRIDTVTVPALAAAQSYHRTGNYGSQWTLEGAAVPSPAPATGQLLVNEIMADNDGAFPDPDEPGAYDDWFEVYNPGTSAVNMSGMYITDNTNNPTKWKVPEGVTIPARGYLVFIADSQATQGPRHTSWSLSADGEVVAIYGTDGTTLIDSVTFGPQRTDVAYGRTTDGASTFSLFTPGTPGAANANPLANFIVNGATFALNALAPNSIASVFAAGIATATVSAPSATLPTTLGNVTVTVVDANNVSRAAPLYFVSAGQANFVVPDGTAPGRATVTLRKQDGTSVSGGILVAPTAAGLFSANATGEGVGYISAVRADAQGNQTPLTAFAFNSAQGKMVATPISLGGATDTVYLVLVGTGLRGAGALTAVTAQVGGTAVPVTYAAAQGQFPGLDQINLGPLPRTLAGRGEVNLYLTVNGHRSNTVTVSIQ
jgi:uncharacterized protein (TIGR03437 family)